MRPAPRLSPALVLIGLALAGPARAADATPEQAAALERQVRAWLADTLGGSVPLPERPVRFAPEGDRYRLSAPLGGAGGPELTAVARQGEGGGWLVEGVRFPSLARFTLTLPVPDEDRPGQFRLAPVEYSVELAEQDASARFDPSYATPATSATSFRSLTLRAQGGGQDQTTRIERYAGQSTVRPSGEGRVDVISDNTAEGYAVASKLSNGAGVQVEAAKLRSNGELTAVSRERAPQLLQALIRLLSGVAAAVPAPGSQLPGGPGGDASALRTLAGALEGLASGGQVEQVAENLRVRMGQFGGSADRFVVGLGATAPEGVLNAHATLGLDGLRLADLPLGPYEALLPRRILLRPTLSGVATADVVRLARGAAVPGAKVGPELAALFGRGAVLGLESVALSIGRTDFTGTATLRAPAPNEVAADGQLAATNLDALIETVKAIPDLAQALPVLVFAKGIGRTAGDRLVWDITYRGGQATVNGVDLGAMAAGPEKKPAPQPGRKK